MMFGRKKWDEVDLNENERIKSLREEVQKLLYAPLNPADITLRKYRVFAGEGKTVVEATGFSVDRRVVSFYRNFPTPDKYSWSAMDECFIQETETKTVAVFWNPVSVVELTE
jgi:hypothetical protein